MSIENKMSRGEVRRGRLGSQLGAGNRPAKARFRSVSGIGSVFAFLLLGLFLLSGAAQAESQSSGVPLDLNRATAEQLETLPGIGAVKAAAILAVRDTKGGFQSMDELEAVRGIGPALVDKLRPLVKLSKQKAVRNKAANK